MKLNAAYLAGVVDSDGSFTIYKQHSSRKTSTYTPTFQLQWTKSAKSKKVMENLLFQYGGSVCSPNGKTNRFANSKPTYKYCLTSTKLKRFLIDVIPFLLLKKEQAENLLKLIHFNESIFGSGKAKPKNVIKAQEILRIKTLRLNGSAL